MGMTRRRFVAHAGLAAAALAGLRPAPLRAQATASRIVWRGIALGPGGVGDTQTYAANRRFFDETDTPWVRFWAHWPVLQPERSLPPDRGSGAAAVARLDAGIDAANADGRRVMLTARRFPRWANGTEQAPLGARPDPGYRLPADLSPGSDWAAWIDFLLTRYGDRIEALELLNEPNPQLWPQADAPDATARMLVTAQAVASRHLGAPLLVGPAMSDRTGYSVFMRALLDRLDARGFVAGPNFAWSHHSYADVEGDLAGPANRTAAARALLVGRWAGWPAGDAANPGVLITETGARLERVGPGDGALSRSRQAELLDRYWQRMQFGPEGPGVAMILQYLFVSDKHYDCGLCDPDATPRPAYRTWGR